MQLAEDCLRPWRVKTRPPLLAGLGVGLRLSDRRSSFARVIHVDLAVPPDSDPSLKTVELLFEARREF